jgi:thiamine-phosphate pyrophosphorylase
MRGLYAIVDVEALERRKLDPLRFAEAVLRARPAAIQLRDKAGGPRRTLELLRAIAPFAAAARVPFFANDRPDLALLAGCDGVHVGQDDLPVALVRRLAGTRPLQVGLSTHNEEQVEAAIHGGGDGEHGVPDYIAIGPIFATTNKLNPSPVIGIAGLDRLIARILAVRPKMPIVAIGGISIENVHTLAGLPDAVAVIGALLPRESPEDPLSAWPYDQSFLDLARRMRVAFLGPEGDRS